MTHAKDRYYWAQLRAALLAGRWSSGYPARAINGSPLSWKDLIRKFHKHSGNDAVAEVASQTRTLGVLLDFGGADESREVSGNRPLHLGGECTLRVEHLEEGQAGYESLKSLQSANLTSVHLALAYHAYALGKATDCLYHISQATETCSILNHIPTSEPSHASTTHMDQGSGVHPSYAPTAGIFKYSSDNSTQEVRDGKGWAMTEAFRSVCLQGMSYERLHPSDTCKALGAYNTVIPLFSMISSEFLSSWSPQSAGKDDLTPYSQLRELWRWVERLIWRAVILCAKTRKSSPSTATDVPLWNWFRQYTTFSIFWPPNFCAEHRTTICSLYLRSLVLDHKAPAPPYANVDKLPAWLQMARSAVQDYRAILDACTSFPPAGQHNTAVEELVDLCVVIWEKSGAVGEHGGWVIDILWWATRFTFNSPRILRHMTRLLCLSGDTRLAKRTLHVYVQVVGKAWQTSKESINEDTDTDQNWVDTLIFGSRMLCKSASRSPGLEEIHDVREAGRLVEKARTRLDANNASLVAHVELADAIWRTVLALKEQDPHTRPGHFAAAHRNLVKSVETYPLPAAYFQLAMSFARAGQLQNLDKAIKYSGLAVESNATDVRYWHLLGLLLTAVEKWSAGAEALENGASLDRSDTESPLDEKTTTDGDQSLPATSEKPDRLADGCAATVPNGQNSTINRVRTEKQAQSQNTFICIVDHDTDRIPSASSLLKPLLDNIRPSEHEVFEHSLQLRLTQAVLTEVMEGPEGAEQKWYEIFSWIAEKKGATNESTSKTSLDGHPALSDANDNNPSRPPVVHGKTHAPDPSLPEAPPMTFILTVPPPAEETRPKETDSLTEKKSNRKSSSSFTDRDASKSKKVQQMLKSHVHKGQARISAVSKMIGNNVVRNGALRRSHSTPDLHAVLNHNTYQASSIHSRKRLSSLAYSHDRSPTSSPHPPPSLPVPPTETTKRNSRSANENRLLSDLWLMAAATFRRLGKIEQAKGSIQEAEVRDEGNPAVWVQLGLYHLALRNRQNAIDTFQKALFISPDDIAATVHLSQIYLDPQGSGRSGDHDDDRCEARGAAASDEVDLAAGLLGQLTRGPGWDIPEAWYFLGKAYGLQGRKDREERALAFALELSEARGVRDIRVALGCCCL